VDNKAWEAAEEIRRTPGADPVLGAANEHGTLIYRDSMGSLKYAPLSTRGSPDNVVISAPGVNFRDVIGIIHNHPIHLGGVDIANNRPSPDDWAQFDQLYMRVHQVQGNASDLRTYIIGPDGQVRQYDSRSVRSQ
jgi:hypothetical protein